MIKILSISGNEMLRQKTLLNIKDANSFRNQNFCRNLYIRPQWFRFQVCWTLDWDRNVTFGDNWNWKRWNTIPTTTVNSTLAQHSINMLALCYIPGLVAAYIQLIRGTKYIRFPNWLDKWLRMRKQIGLLMLFSASLHVRRLILQN